MRKLLFMLLAIPCIAVQAQTIKGVVYAKQEKAPVEFSSVALLNLPDSAIITGTSTKASGAFEIENVKPGNYYVKATNLGYAPGGKSIKIASGSKIVILDTIFISVSSKQLGEVKITGERIKGTELVDRSVYAIPAEIAKSSVNGFEIIRKIPGVQVDFNNNITLNGKTNFLIQVDGKQRDQQYLNRLNPSDIKSVEIINNPSGKYEGTIDGIINIILKMEARVGVNGNFSGMIRPSDKPSGYGSGSLEYGFGKLSIYASGYSFFQRLENNVVNSSNFKFNDSINDFKGVGNFKISASSINTGFDYYMNDKNNLSFNFSFKPTYNVSGPENSGFIYKPHEVQNSYFSSPSSYYTKSGETNTSLYYKRTFAKPIKEFSAEFTFYTFSSNDTNRVKYYYYTPDQAVITKKSESYDNNKNDRKYFSGKIDYVLPLGFSSRLEMGYQFYYQGINYDFKSSNIFSNNVYKYAEMRNSAYSGLIWNLGKFGFQTSLRGEYSNIKINESKNSEYLTLLPAANIQYKISGKQNVKLTYNRRINRPGVYDLNPFVRFNTDLGYTQGNPDLKPEYRNRFQLTYTLTLGSNYISPSFYHEISTNRIGTLNSVMVSPTGKDTARFAMPQNILSGYESGIGLNAMLYFINFNGRFYRGHYNEYNYIVDSKLSAIPGRDYSSYSVTSYAFAQMLKKTLTGYLFVSYNGVVTNAQSKTYSTPMYGFGAQKTAGNHTFGFFYFLPFKKEYVYSKTVTETPGFNSTSISSFDVSYYVQIMYSFKFNKGKAVKKISKKVEVESDTKSGGLKTN